MFCNKVSVNCITCIDTNIRTQTNTVLDDGSLELSEGQLADRFAAETGALTSQQRSVTAEQFKRATQSPSPTTQTAAAPSTVAPLGRSYLSQVLGPTGSSDPAPTIKRGRSGSTALAAKASPALALAGQPPAKKPKAQAKQTPQTSPSKGPSGPMPMGQMQAHYAECDHVIEMIEKATTLDEVSLAEQQIKKVTQAGEKKRQQIQSMQLIDQVHLEYQIKLDDYNVELLTFANLITAYKKHCPAGKKQSNASPQTAQDLKEAFGTLLHASPQTAQDRKVPPVFMQAKYELDAAEAQQKGDMVKFVQLLTSVLADAQLAQKDDFIEALRQSCSYRNVLGS